MPGFAPRHPTSDDYIAAVKAAAKSNPKIHYTRLFMDTRKRSCVLIRWRAWRDLQSRNFSVLGIARTSGFDHTTVLHGLKQLQKIDRDSASHTSHGIALGS